MQLTRTLGSGLAVALCLCAQLAACASHHPAAAASGTPAAQSVPASSTPPTAAAANAAIRKLPRAQYRANIDWYPPEARRRQFRGRVLVVFQIDQTGKAVASKVLIAEAPRILQEAALDFVRDVRFDPSDPNFDAADPAPFAMSVRFCIVDCGPLVGFAGYEDIRITGSPLLPR